MTRADDTSRAVGWRSVMTRRRWLLTLTSVALLLAGGAAVWLQARSPAPFVYRWPAGNVYTYQVTLRIESRLVGDASYGMASQPALAALSLDGELELRSYGRSGPGGDYVLGARLGRLRSLDWSLGKRSILHDGGRSLVGQEVKVVLSPEGRIRSLNAPADAPHRLVNLLRQVLAQLEVVVAPGARSWTRQQTNPAGRVRVGYAVSASRSDALVLQRRPLRYTHLAAGAFLRSRAGVNPTGVSRVVLDRAGHLRHLEGQEEIDAAGASQALGFRERTRIVARLRGVTRATPGEPGSPGLAGLVATRLDDVSVPEDAGQRELEKRAGDLTMERLLQDLLRYGSAAQFPELARWLWRATGLLLAHPERCRDLVAVFEAPGLTHAGRLRVLDLLVATGSPAAQTVLRELLDRPTAKGSVRHGELLQRLSLLALPDTHTVAYLREQVERGEGAHTLAAAHALGAALGNRARAGAEVDPRSAELLREGMTAARSTRERVGWLGTLGNAGLVEDVPLVARYATASDPAVRAAVPDALRKVQTPASERVLLDLAADPDRFVQERALHTLTGYEITTSHLATLRSQVTSGALVPESYGMLATLLARNREQPQAVLPVIQAMLDQGVANQRLLLRLRDLQQSLRP